MEKNKQKLRKWYNEIASKYDSWGTREGEFSASEASEEVYQFSKILDRVQIGKKDKILDVAVGTGIYLLETMKRGGEGFGIDISENMLAVLNQKNLGSSGENKVRGVCLADAAALPFHAGVFDLILCIGLFDCYDFNMIKIFLDEIKRVARTKCMFIVDFPDNNKKETLVFRDKERSVGHEVYLHASEEIESFLHQQGFGIMIKKEAGIEIQYLLVKK